MSKQPSVSIVIPMYNEKEQISFTISELVAFLDSISLDYEIIIVDDGSTDGSPDIVCGIIETTPQIGLITLNRNLGIGRALRAGFASAKNDIIIYTDADLPVGKNIFKDALDLLSNNRADIVIGSRVGRRESLSRYVYTQTYNAIVRCLFNVKLKDINAGMKVFRREIVDTIRLKSDGPFIDTELLINSLDKGFKIYEIEVSNIIRKNRKSRFAAAENVAFTIYKLVFELINFYIYNRKIKDTKLRHTI